MEIKLGSPDPYPCLTIKMPVAGMHVPKKNGGKSSGRGQIYKLE